MGDFYVQMAKMAEGRLDEINAQNFANNEWAFATGGQKEELLFNELARLAERHLDGVNKLGLANNAWASASLGLKDVRRVHGWVGICSVPALSPLPFRLGFVGMGYRPVESLLGVWPGMLHLLALLGCIPPFGPRLLGISR